MGLVRWHDDSLREGGQSGPRLSGRPLPRIRPIQDVGNDEEEEQSCIRATNAAGSATDAVAPVVQ